MIKFSNDTKKEILKLLVKPAVKIITENKKQKETCYNCLKKHLA